MADKSDPITKNPQPGDFFMPYVVSEGESVYELLEAVIDYGKTKWRFIKRGELGPNHTLIPTQWPAEHTLMLEPQWYRIKPPEFSDDPNGR